MLNARFGHDWVKKHGFDNTGKLPAKAPKRKGRKQTREGIKQRDNARLAAAFRKGGKRGRY
jgi:hypothetical protein